MVLPKFSSVSTLSLAGVVLLVGGLGVAIFASQQQQDNRSKAAYNPADPKPGDFIQSGVLPLDGGAAPNPGIPPPKTHIGNLTVGVTYKIVAKGYYRYQKNVNYNSLTDLEWDDWLQGNDGCFCHSVSDENGGRLDFNGIHPQSIDYKTSYNPNHVYTYLWTADRDYLDIFVWDTHYHDNVVIEPITFEMFVESVPGDTTAPTVPTNLTAAVVSSSQINLSWTASTDAVGVKGYKIFRDGNEVGTTTGTTYEDKNLTADTIYKYTVSAFDEAGNNSAKSNEVTAKTSLATQPNTSFDFSLLFHGIGKAGDNRDPNVDGEVTGTTAPTINPRPVTVDVYDFDKNLIISKEGQVAYDLTFGGYKGAVDMGTTLQSQAYEIRVKFTHSLRASISRNIKAGEPNIIPVMKLVNGDANNDAKLDILDYNIIEGCVEDLDFNLPAKDCNPTKKLQADIDDDGKVGIFDLNLFLREMSVQQL